jgi:MoaA/NifB/PqqE/SkfB family radical SAM enzyme
MANIGYVQLNRICNQACLFCSNPDTGATLDIINFKKKINDFVKRKYAGVVLTGGEPTLCEYLPEAIRYCQTKKMDCRLITNGQKTADFNYLNKLAENGLHLMHVSFYSYRPQLQNYLSQNKNSYSNILKTLHNSAKLKIAVNINTVINKYNADHLDKTVFFLVKKFSFINHFVFNNIDPYTNRAVQNVFTIPQLKDFKNSLNKAMQLLVKKNKTFRVERVPLCYMGDFPQFSTETRKIVKKEERIVHFLDDKGFLRQTAKGFNHEKGKICHLCRLEKICAGLCALGKFFDENELTPVVNKDPQNIINKIKHEAS